MSVFFGDGFARGDPGWKPDPPTRGTYNILSTCLVTLGLCIWTAIHLNIPEYRASWRRQVWRKIGWMVLGFIAPELVRPQLRHILRRQVADTRVGRFHGISAVFSGEESIKEDESPFSDGHR